MAGDNLAPRVCTFKRCCSLLNVIVCGNAWLRPRSVQIRTSTNLVTAEALTFRG